MATAEIILPGQPSSYIPINHYEMVICFMVVVLALKFIIDIEIDLRREVSKQFSEYGNKIKEAINGESKN